VSAPSSIRRTTDDAPPAPSGTGHAAPAKPSLADAAHAAEAPSPAKALQESLSAALAADEALEAQPGPHRKWSRRATMLFVLTTCGGFWLAVAVAVGLQLGR